MSATPWMEIAWAEQGVKEIEGAEHEPAIVAYFREVGRTDILNDETSWCAAFVGACLARAGLKPSLRPHEQVRALAYLDVGTPIDTPRVGCIVVFGWDETRGHVGFCVGVSDKTIAILGGNQGGQVKVSHFKKDRISGYRWPGAPKTTTEVAAAGSRTVAQAGKAKTDVGAVLAVTATAPVIEAAAPAMPDLGQLAEQATATKAVLTQLTDFVSFATGNWQACAIGIAAWLGLRALWRSGLIERFRVEDANTGKTNA